MSKKSTIRLWSAQHRKLRRVIRVGQHSAREILRAHILLKTADGWTNQQIVDAFFTSHDTIQRPRTRFIAEGLEAALHEQARPGAPLKLTTQQGTLLIALACSKPPAGHRRWTVRLLAERAVKLEIVEPTAPETIRRILKKIQSSHGS